MTPRTAGNDPNSSFSPFPDAPSLFAESAAFAPAAFLVADATAMPFDLLQEEVRCARLFNLELPESLDKAVHALTQAAQTFTRSDSCRILWFNAASGRYLCLSDLATPAQAPREIAHVTAQALETLVGASPVAHVYLFEGDTLVGLVAMAVSPDASAEDALWRELALELMAPYLAVKVSALVARRQDRLLAGVREKALNAAQRLMTAVDVETVLGSSLEACCALLGFGIAQYAQFERAHDAEAPEILPEVLMERRQGEVRSFLHAGLKSKRRALKRLPALLSLFSDGVRPGAYVRLSAAHLADPLAQEALALRRLGPAGVKEALILPVPDPTAPATGEPFAQTQGALILFRLDAAPLTPDVSRTAVEIAAMTGMALSRARVLEKALELATTDELTALTNRRGFYDRFESELERARRQQSPLCAAMIDVDYFKRLNDAYGHLNGDIALRTLAAKIRASLRKSDLVCRFGGEEFAVLLPDTGFAAALDLMERLRRAVEETIIVGVDHEAIHATISVGVAPVRTAQGLSLPPRELISEALAAADEQLYRAKNAGRNRVFPQETASGEMRGLIL